MSRTTLTVSLDPVRNGSRCPVHESHCLALVGEAPGPNTHSDMPLYPYPERSAAGRLCEMFGEGRSGYLKVFARANLLDKFPGSSFPVKKARAAAEPLAQRLAPRPLILLGQGVAQAFSFPTEQKFVWVDYQLGVTLIRAALIPHPSGRNLWYNHPVNREKCGAWLREQARLHRAEQK